MQIIKLNFDRFAIRCRRFSALNKSFVDIHQNSIKALGYDPLAYLRIIPNYLSKESQNVLEQLTISHLKRLTQSKYDEGHYDAVIKGYKECSVASLSEHPIILATTDMIACELISADTSVFEHWLSPHILELRGNNSYILAHTDNTSASGNIVAGLCLLSDTTMVFKHKTLDVEFTALLPMGCLYYQWDKLRYEFEHSIPEEQIFKGLAIEKGRRISIMLRNVNADKKFMRMSIK